MSSIIPATSNPASSKKPVKTVASLIEEREKLNAAFVVNALHLEHIQWKCNNLEAAFMEAKLQLDRENAKKKKIETQIFTEKNRKQTIDDQIADLEFQEDLKKIEKQRKSGLALAKKNMPKGIYSEAILEKINKLPEILVEMIGEYLPISVKNNLLSEELYKKIGKIGNADVRKGFFRAMTKQPAYFTILNREEARSKIYLINGSFNPEYKSYSWFMGSMYIKKEIHKLINLAKEKNPVFAYKMLTFMAVFNASGKKLRVNHRIVDNMELTQADLPIEYL
jgi:hypothetical protein